MAVTNGTVSSVRTIESGAWDPLWQCAEITFTMSGTYDTASHSKLLAVATLIQNARRNGKTVTMRSVMAGRPATSSVDNSQMPLASVAISTNDVSFNITTDWSTEITNSAAIPGQNRPFSILVAFTEA